jgi:hypothetical protein
MTEPNEISKKNIKMAYQQNEPAPVAHVYVDDNEILPNRRVFKKQPRKITKFYKIIEKWRACFRPN